MRPYLRNWGCFLRLTGRVGFLTRRHGLAIGGVGEHLSGRHPHPSPLPSRERGFSGMRTAAALLFLLPALAAAACSNEEAVCRARRSPRGASRDGRAVVRGGVRSSGRWARRVRRLFGGHTGLYRRARIGQGQPGRSQEARRGLRAHQPVPSGGRPAAAMPSRPSLPIRHRRLRQVGEAAAIRLRCSLSPGSGSHQRRQVPELACRIGRGD